MRMLYKLLPGLLWLKGYNKHTFSGDLFSGLTIGVLLIPQSVGYAVVAGLPPEVGLYAWIKQRPTGTLQVVILDAQAISSVNSTSQRMLTHVIENLRAQNVRFYLASVIGPVRDTLMNSSLSDYVQQEHLFSTIHDTVTYVDEGVYSRADIAIQSNRTRRRSRSTEA